MKPLTLTEVSKLVEELSPEEAISNDSIQEFLTSVERAGKDLLKERGGVKYVKDASDLLLAASVAEFIGTGDFKEAMILLSNATIFGKIMGIAFIYSVGIGVVEELH